MKQALREAVAKIPNPYESAGIILIFLKTTYCSIKWPNKQKATLKSTETIKDTSTSIPAPTDKRRRTWGEGEGEIGRGPTERTKDRTGRVLSRRTKGGIRDYPRSRDLRRMGAARENGQNGGGGGGVLGPREGRLTL